MSYPTSITSFTTKQDGVDYPQVAHINGLQTEVTAIESGLISGLQHPLTIAIGGLTQSASTGTNSFAGSLQVTGNSTFAGNVTITGTLTATGGLGKPYVVFTAAHNQPPASAYATLDTRNAHLVLDFDGATDEEAIFPGVLPVGYSGGGLAVDIYVAFTSATSGSVRFQADIERIDTSSLDIDSDGFTGTFQSAGGTAPGTSGQVIKVTITFTAGAQMDSLAAGEAFRLKIRRDADGTSGTDDIASDCELLRVVVREP